MADIVFNIAKGRAAHLASLPAASDGLVAVPIEAAGLVDDATMRDYPTLAALLAGPCNEQITMGRQPLAAVAVVVDQENDRVDVDAQDVTWPAATGNPTGAVVVCYDPDTTASSDANLVPISKHDMAAAPSGGDITAQFPAAGFYRAI